MLLGKHAAKSRSDTCRSSSQHKQIINKTYPTQVFEDICRLPFSSSHTLPPICPRLSRINISLASLSTHPSTNPLTSFPPTPTYSVLPSHFTLFHAVFLPLPRLSSSALRPAPLLIITPALPLSFVYFSEPAATVAETVKEGQKWKRETGIKRCAAGILRHIR